MTTTATHLRTIAVHWADLRDALDSTGLAAWPPAGRMGDYLSALDRADEQLVEAARWQAAYNRQYLDRDPSQVGETRPPLRIAILDTMRVVEAALTQCADDIARQVQREPMAMPTARRAAYASEREARLAYDDRQRRAALAKADLADPRRWRHTGQRDAVRASLWLLARVVYLPGRAARSTSSRRSGSESSRPVPLSAWSGLSTSLRRPARWPNGARAVGRSTCTVARAGHRSRTAQGAGASGRRAERSLLLRRDSAQINRISQGCQSLQLHFLATDLLTTLPRLSRTLESRCTRRPSGSSSGRHQYQRRSDRGSGVSQPDEPSLNRPNHPEWERLAVALRSLMAGAGLTQRQVAQRMSVSQATLSRYMTGHRLPPEGLLEDFVRAVRAPAALEELRALHRVEVSKESASQRIDRLEAELRRLRGAATIEENAGDATSAHIAQVRGDVKIGEGNIAFHSEAVQKISHTQTKQTRISSLLLRLRYRRQKSPLWRKWLSPPRDDADSPVSRRITTIPVPDLMELGDQAQSAVAAHQMSVGLDRLFRLLGPPPQGLTGDREPELQGGGGTQR